MEKKFAYIKGNHRRVLKYILQWVSSSRPPKSMLIDDQPYFWFSLKKIADDLDLSYYQVKTVLYRLEGRDKSVDYMGDEPFIYSQMVYARSETNKLYIAINHVAVARLFEGENAFGVRGQEVVEPLFEVEEKPRVNEFADRIARKLLADNPDIFRTRAGDSKTYCNCCRIITDIFNGVFLNPHAYTLFGIDQCKWFDTDGWRDRLREVKGDWNKVRKLLFQAVRNFRLMFEERNMPEKKDYLPDSLETWLYDSRNEKYPSYFVYSFNEPNYTQKQYGENKADDMFKLLPRKMQEAGNRLVDMFPKGIYPSVLWRNVLDMWVWAKWMIEADENSMYWMTDSSEILNEFMRWCEGRNIRVNISTINIRTAVEHNSPWVWFVQEACERHGLNSNLCDCVTKRDFEKLYRKKIVFELKVA